ncbi:MAG: hypothetical protein E6K41_02915 [Gammaproteobacteria bacterium]|nr:MAG: hypothetical protein E6K41_02915 [Gammaproteobacteria bacterium]
MPSRKALVARLEAQRTDLLRAMACVNRARRTLEEHVAEGPAGRLQRISPPHVEPAVTAEAATKP